MAVVRVVLSQAFLEDFIQPEMTDSQILGITQIIMKYIGSDPTNGRRIVSLFSNKSIYPGSGYYEVTFHRDVFRLPFSCKTLHFYGTLEMPVRIVRFSRQPDNIVNFYSPQDLEEYRLIGRSIIGYPIEGEDQ